MELIAQLKAKLEQEAKQKQVLRDDQDKESKLNELIGANGQLQIAPKEFKLGIREIMHIPDRYVWDLVFNMICCYNIFSNMINVGY